MTSRFAAASFPVTSPILRGRNGSGASLRDPAKSPSPRELLLQPLERREVVALAEALERERAQLELALRREQLRPPVHVRALALLEVEPQRVELAARDRARQARAVGRILEREEDVRPAGVAAELRDLALDPDGREAGDPVGDAAVERGDGVDLAVAVLQGLDLRHEADASPKLEQDLGGRLGRAAGAEELDRAVQVGLAPGDPLGEREREPGLDEDVQTPALDLRPLALPSMVSVSLMARLRSW